METPSEERGICGVHVDKPLISFCLYHYQPCCQICVQTFHSKCGKMQPLDNGITAEDCKSLIGNLIGRLDITSSKIEEVIMERHNNLEDLDSQQKELEASISKLREVINSHFDELEYKLHQEVFLAHQKCVKKIKEEIREFERRQETLLEHKNVLELYKKKKTGGGNFSELNEIATHQRDYEEYLKNFVGNLYCFDYELKFKTEILNLKSSLKSLGEMEVQTYPTSYKLPNDLDELKDRSRRQLKDCIALETYCFSLTPKKEDPFVTGGTFLPDGNLLLADMGNSKLYIVNTLGSFEDEIDLHGDPFDVSMVNDSTAAVTIPKSNLIQYVDVKTKTIGKKFRLKERPWGISFNGKYIVTICDASIVILDTRGTFIRKFDVSGDVEYITASENCIYYTAGNMPVVRCIDINGKEIFKNVYKNLNRPSGISLDRQGHVYVVGSESSNVHQLEPTGKLIKIIVPANDGITKLRSLKFNAMGEKFFLSHDDAKIRLYQLDYPSVQ